MKFKVHKTDYGYPITGTHGYQLILSNRFDAEKHTHYLNRQYEYCRKLKKKNIEYNVKLTMIKQLIEQLQVESGELHIIELAIQIKKAIREVL